MGGKSRKSGGVSKKLINLIKGGNCSPSTKDKPITNVEKKHKTLFDKS